MENISADIERQCDVLDREVYPAVQSILDSAVLYCCDEEHDMDIRSQSLAVLRIRNEFESLTLLERKLVFRAVKQAGKKKSGFLQGSNTNLGELLRLMKNKDLKIKFYLNLINSGCPKQTSILDELKSSFDQLFDIEKQKLYDLITRLLPFSTPLVTGTSYFNKN
ncbi:MAG: hypothetical protein J5I59_01920 [Saprospiraceae bacterium]|nr:hypothetical protein [Saprospiraceae bacterium]